MGAVVSVDPGVVIQYDYSNVNNYSNAYNAAIDIHTWVASAAHAPVPAFAVVGGHDVDRSPIYVGRGFHEGEHLPAKVIPSKHTAYVAWGGVEHQKPQYEILVGQGYGWVTCAAGSVPPNAVRTGVTRTGESLFVGRGHWQGSLTVGKVHPSHHCLYIPFGGSEIKLTTYEVLVHTPVEHWVAAAPNFTPPAAVVAGYDSDRAPIYVGKAMQDGEMLPAKVVPNKGCAYVCARGQEHAKMQYEVLTGVGYAWVRPHPPHAVPPNAVSTGRSRSGEALYVGRGHWQGSLTPGVVSLRDRCLYIPYGGREIRIDSYEYLCRQ